MPTRSAAPPSTTEPKSTLLFELGAVLLVLLDTLVSYSQAARTLTSSDQIVGGALMPPIVLLIVYGIARALKKARTRRGRAILAFVTLLIIFLGLFGNST